MDQEMHPNETIYCRTQIRFAKDLITPGSIIETILYMCAYTNMYIYQAEVV